MGRGGTHDCVLVHACKYDDLSSGPLWYWSLLCWVATSAHGRLLVIVSHTNGYHVLFRPL